MFHPIFHSSSRHAAIAQVEHEAWIVCGETAELGRGHPGFSEEDLDLTDQHHAAPAAGVLSPRVASLSQSIAVQILLV
jgi:hypothetical protein